ncbi:hypothetical protein LXL04_022784 [Taraxacum kok-saghyz]
MPPPIYQTQTQTQSQSQPDYQTQTQKPRGVEDEPTNSSEEPNDEQPEDLDSPPREKGKKTKTRRVNWTGEEEKTLTEAWIDIYEYPVIGKNQGVKDFKMRVWEILCPHRKTCHPKWRNTDAKVMVFNGIYANITRNKPRIGLEFWEAVRNRRKWNPLESANDFTTPKRSKKSSTTHRFSSNAHTGIDLNNVEQYKEPVQYMGRDQTKDLAKRKLKGVTGSSSSTNAEEVMEKLSRFDNTVESLVDLRNTREKTCAMELMLGDDSHLDKESHLDRKESNSDVFGRKIEADSELKSET